MNKQQRSISFNSVSPFRKQYPPLPKVPLTFGLNLELQKRQHYIQFYEQYSNVKLDNSANNQQIQPEKTNLILKQEERGTSNKLAKQNSSFNDIYYENITTNATNAFDSQTRRATSKLSNYSINNSKTHIKPPIQQLHISQRKSQVDNFNQNKNSSFVMNEVSKEQLRVDYSQGIAQRSISSKNSYRDRISQNVLNNRTNQMQIQNNSCDGINKQKQINKKQLKGNFANDFGQDNDAFKVPDQPRQYNPIHISFYHNYHDQKKPRQQNLIQESDKNSFSNAESLIPKEKKQLKSDEKVYNNFLKIKERKQSNDVYKNANTVVVNSAKQANLTEQRYKKLQDPDRILQYIEQKEIGFDTTPDILNAIEIAQKNTDEQLINRKRQPLAPIPVWQEDNQNSKKTNLVKHIQKFDLDFNQIDEKQINQYIQQKEDFLNQIEIQRYNERYNLSKEKVDQKMKNKKKYQIQKELEKEHDSFEDLHIPLSKLEINKSDSPNLQKIKIKNAKDSPKVVISTKQSSFDMKYGSIQPFKKYRREFDEYSTQQKYLMKTQEQSPLNNGYSGKNEKTKRATIQNNQPSSSDIKRRSIILICYVFMLQINHL
ncbi:hypothetical protein TTHERM_000849520 (macronuclear) [Tetrahymena thermophila SB210]|uniref:Uncharacterized protein n=1 Tax=Tetrahymena thermophila (strain SB210) TaxID=312017 RepID=W7XIT0_TETTS|nr:hypothetical protein TTHERM_000849520 [Tetrahymena thermophila SB210]EWS73584.1 hypothetical protein TTHERM_000849520 [Tetrahymena thermophila SB210]|eukprot:XP_012653880.1 hypothetical protein TTHERM_000849520 [Tetrahymena thermophila SB210]